jgi:hypothetical protein
LFLIGAALFCAGSYFLISQWMLAALVSGRCHRYWDVDPWCRQFAFTTYAALVAPGPGLAMMAIAVFRAFTVVEQKEI